MHADRLLKERIRRNRSHQVRKAALLDIQMGHQRTETNSIVMVFFLEFCWVFVLNAQCADLFACTTMPYPQQYLPMH